MLRQCVAFMLLAAPLYSDVSAQQDSSSGILPKVRSISIERSGPFDVATLLKQLRFTQVGGLYKPSALEIDLEFYLNAFLEDQGYLSSQVRWRVTLVQNGFTKFDQSDGVIE